MKFLTKKDYDKKTEGNRYWINKVNRWDYMKIVIDEVKKYNPKKMLEVGSKGIPLSYDSDLLSLEKDDLVNKKGKIHDLNVFPFPYESKQFDFFIALQVWEHLQKQKKSFKEARRISKNIVLSIPYHWTHVDENDCHYNIGDETMLKWTNGLEPTFTKQVLNRKIYFYLNEKEK